MDYRRPDNSFYEKLIDQQPDEPYRYESETIQESAERFIDRYMDGDVNKQDEFGNTLLHYAIKNKLYDLCEYLLIRGMCPNIKNKEGNTAMIYSVLYGGYMYVRLLLENGGDPNIPDNFGGNCFDISNEKKINDLLHTFYPSE